MLYVRELMEMFDVSEDTAMEIYNLMDLDFSECTREEFDDEAMVAYNRL